MTTRQRELAEPIRTGQQESTGLKGRWLTYRQIRWVIVGLLFFSALLNYIDRQTLSILAPTLRREFNLTERGYANVVTGFLVSYTVMYSVAGRLIDWIGVRIGLAVSILWWSIAAMLTAAARGQLSLLVFRFLLGIGEPGNVPAGYRATSEWFPKRERALPGSIFISGSAVGATVAPLLVAGIAFSSPVWLGSCGCLYGFWHIRRLRSTRVLRRLIFP
jgi:ACS family hexuronate transporter-like MFS transporter